MTARNAVPYRRTNLAEWLLLALAVSILAGSLALWHTLESARVTAAENDRLHALSKILVKEVAVHLLAVNNALSGIIRDRLDVRGHFDHARVTGRLRALVEAMPGVRGILVLDAAGNVVAAVPADLVGRNFSRRPYFTVPRQGGDAATLYMTPPFRSVRNDAVMTVTRIVAGPGGFHGVVTAVLDPGYFSDVLHTALYAPDMRATMGHSNGGTFVAIGAPDAGGAGPTLSAGAAVAPANVRTDSTVALTLHRDLAVVQAPLKRQALAFAVVFATLALACAGALWWFQVRRSRLRDAARRHQDAVIHAEALGASEARFRMLIEEAPVAVAMSRQGRFIYTNRRYNLLHGYAATEDLTGLPWRAMIAPDSLRGLQEQEATLAADAAVEQRFEAIGVGNGDTLIPLLKATTRVTLADGPATLIFVQDITAQKTAEMNLLDARDAAQAANRSKAEFLANMSHEIRTPLNAILGMAYLLERGNRDAEAASMLQKIRVAGRSLLGIINDILDVSKIEAGAMVIERSWFQLQDVIDTVAATMGVAVGDKPIVLLIRPLPPAAACVMGDALRLEQLLVNLASNAIKFTERGRVELTVGATLQPDGQAALRFQVSDTGIGIAAAQQDSVFSPFIQADSSTTRRYGGSGLGLTICKQIVALMGGHIGMHSEPGAGSTFWFTLTLPVHPEAASSSSPEMVNLDVIIATPIDPTLTVLADTARALGWRVRSAATDAEVVAHVRGNGRGALPGVVILEWQQGGAACMATARAIRADPAADACAIVIVITAYQAAACEADQARQLADAMLTTPVTASTLYNAVIEARRKRATDDRRDAPRAPGRQALAGLRILVVDDSGINREVAERILAEEGAVVALAENGRVAIDWLLAHAGAIDLVLMDVQMPVMDGIEATRILRGMPRFALLPIVALTAGAFSSHQEAARRAGMNHFIAKPFDVPLTIELIRRMAADVDPAGLPLPAAAARGVAARETPGVLDLRRGLKTWGTRANYRRYLRKFAAAYGEVVAAMQRDAASGNDDAVAATAHKLAGAAANVALPVVGALARRLESALPEPGSRTALLAELDVAMGAALDAIAAFAPPAAAGAAPAGPLAASAAVPPLLERMLAALEEGMPEPALAALDALAPHLPAAALAPIAACIDDFDWPGAARHTAALVQRHPHPAPG